MPWFISTSDVSEHAYGLQFFIRMNVGCERMPTWKWLARRTCSYDFGIRRPNRFDRGTLIACCQDALNRAEVNTKPLMVSAFRSLASQVLSAFCGERFDFQRATVSCFVNIRHSHRYTNKASER